MNNKNNCLICESEIEYFAESKKMPCSICGEVHETTAACKNGHYICDSCHAASAFRHIYKYCLNSKSQDPTQIMRELMNLPSIHMHGPEHHVLVGAALLTAYHNAGGELPLGIAASLQEMTKRGKQVPGGCCGLWGACGAAISSGMFVSILSGASPLSREARKADVRPAHGSADGQPSGLRPRRSWIPPGIRGLSPVPWPVWRLPHKFCPLRRSFLRLWHRVR